MSGLNDKDFRVLQSYAKEGNRELYWNYLAQVPGNDGYGLLALGVVRHDSLPGRVAVGYAQDYAEHQRERGSQFANKVLDEPALEAFGQELIRQDLAQRQAVRGTDLSLNLPGKAVQDAHDVAFDRHKIDPNAWTPRVLLEAARNRGGDQAAEQIWKDMLDNSALGVVRTGKTLGSIAQNMDLAEGARYAGTLTSLEIQSMGARSSVDPNVIGTQLKFHYFQADRQQWYQVDAPTSPLPRLSPVVQEETNPAKIAELNAAREVRLERQAKATAFHPDDHYRDIARSPLTAGITPENPHPTQLAGLTPMQPGHPDHPLYQQIRDGVAALDAKHGRSFDATSERMTASLLVLAKDNGLDRVDHVIASNATGHRPAGYTLFVVQGEPSTSAHLHADIATEQAANTSVEASMQQLDTVSREANQRAQTQQIEQNTQNAQHEAHARVQA
ncbi:XVIPCD domain-containing protein [Stenotrophomonas lactitubi]|uniref:XVIPCD domain-containing protein n=1 Tax=Stenotrophomonas lactitubi TaxID=2045214 RepID=UPI0038764470